MVAASLRGPLAACVALAFLMASAIAGDVEFPTSEFETSLRVVPAAPSTDDAKRPSDKWEVTSSWSTQTGRTYMVEARATSDEWAARSEPFDGDGRPVDFLDEVGAEDFPVIYRLVSHRSADAGDVRVSRLRPGLDRDASTNSLSALLEFRVAPDFRYEVQKSYYLTAWRNRISVAEYQGAYVTIEDPRLVPGRTAHYRILAYKIGRRRPAGTPQLATSASANGRQVLPDVPPHEEEPKSVAPTSENGGRGSLQEPHRIVRSIRFTVNKKTVPSGTQYVVIPLGIEGEEAVGLNDDGDILLAGVDSGGARDMILWIAGERHNLSEMTGVRFHRVLDIDNSRAVVGTVLEASEEKVLGFRYTPRKGSPPELTPLSTRELEEFRFERMEPVFEGGTISVDGHVYPLYFGPPNEDREAVLLKPIRRTEP
jgi:hypothetical protein